MSGKNLKKIPLDDRTTDLMNCRTIKEQLPVRLRGTFVINEFGGECLCCDQPIATANMKGRVSVPFPFVAVIEAAGFCPECKFITRFRMRIKDDRTVEYLDREGAWAKEIVPAPSRLTRQLDKLRQYFSAQKCGLKKNSLFDDDD
ncbi:MAG: hypothetical protein WCZ10_10550 [Desulfobulbaceae bacterium]